MKKDYLRFVEEFDGYVVKEGIPAESLMEYEGIIMRLRDRAKNAFDDGVKDGSIRRDLEFELWYMTIGRSLMALAQKLALRGHILSYDETVDDKAQMTCMIDMVMRYLK